MYAGVATVSEVMLEHRRVDELREKVKNNCELVATPSDQAANG
jgi:hypothetical protein